MERKWPGKICRQGQFCGGAGPHRGLSLPNFIQQNQYLDLDFGYGTALAWLMPDRRHGSDVPVQPKPQRGAEDAKRSVGESMGDGLRRVAGAAVARRSRGCDTLNNIPFTKQSLQAMLERMGVNIRGATIRTGNVAAVMVTGNLPAFGTQGTRMDVTVSSLGDAKNLEGGPLLVTPLLGADGNVYAVGQGSVSIGGFQAQGQAASITRGVPTVGRIANGAIIEREIEFALNRLPNVRLALRNADFTTAKRIAAAVNDYLGAKCAEPIDPSTVQLSIPAEFKGNVVAFLTEIEQLQVEPDLAARIVIDERSGIIVMGRDVRVATVAVAQGNLTVTISESPQVSQPNPLSRGRTVVTPNSRVGVTEEGKKFALVKDGVSLQQLVDGLNGLGIGPRDLIGILQAIKAAGAIEADIEVM